jgi:hypothetical protein
MSTGENASGKGNAGQGGNGLVVVEW